MSKSAKRSDRTSAVIWGLILIVVGGWLLLDTLGFGLPGLDRMWPIFPTLVGMAFFVGWLFSSDKRGNYGIAIPGTINLLIGLFFFGFTLGFFRWSDMAYLWPVFPLIVGIAFVVAWVFSLFSAWGLLIPGGITGTVGIVGLAFTLGHLDNLYLNLLTRGWPVLVILVGVVLLFQSLFGKAVAPKRPSQQEGVSLGHDEAVLEEFEQPTEETEAKAFKVEQ